MVFFEHDALTKLFASLLYNNETNGSQISQVALRSLFAIILQTYKITHQLDLEANFRNHLGLSGSDPVREERCPQLLFTHPALCSNDISMVENVLYWDGILSYHVLFSDNILNNNHVYFRRCRGQRHPRRLQAQNKKKHF